MKDVALVTPQCIYRIEGGLVLFSESAVDDGEEITFDGRQTAVLNTVRLADGTLAVQAERMDDSTYTIFAGRLVVSKFRIIAIQNTVNLDMLRNARKAINRLEIVKGPGR